MRATSWACLTFLLLSNSLCHAAEPAQPPLKFWHTQSQNRAELLNEIITEYNASGPAIPIEAIYQGSYDDIYRKTRANLIANSPPDMAVAYESYVNEFKRLRDVVDLDRFVRDPQIGFTPQELDDFYPVFLEANRYPEHDNALLSFPFTKSLLVLYVNEDLVKKAGFAGPPKTWDEFHAQCVAMKKIGKKGYAMDVDASTLDGMFMSRNAQLVSEDGRSANFDSEPVIEALDFLMRLVKEGGAEQIDGATDEDVRRFAQGDFAFFIRSSTRRPDIQRTVADAFAWSMHPLPAGKGQEPMTVMFGANICIFPSTAEREKAAWQFIKHFASPEITARWAVGSGYLPVRRSAEKLPVMQQWLNEDEINRQVFAMIPLGRQEPAPTGWQQVRDLVVKAATDAIIGRAGKSPKEIALELDHKADEALSPPQASTGITAKILMAIVLLVAAALTGKLILKKIIKESPAEM